jgi:hypothetical protein
VTPGTVTRVVGVCSHCGGNVLLRVQHGLPTERSASCGCGATVIPAGFFRVRLPRRSKAVRG